MENRLKEDNEIYYFFIFKSSLIRKNENALHGNRLCNEIPCILIINWLSINENIWKVITESSSLCIVFSSMDRLDGRPFEEKTIEETLP